MHINFSCDTERHLCRFSGLYIKRWATSSIGVTCQSAYQMTNKRMADLARSGNVCRESALKIWVTLAGSVLDCLFLAALGVAVRANDSS